MICLIVVQASASQSPQESAFEKGLAAFQKGDFKQARTAFQDALPESGQESSQESRQNEDNPTVLFNLGLTEQRLGNLGMALAIWRKALAIKANFSPAERAIVWARGKLGHPEIAHEVELWESVRSTVIVNIPLWYYLLATAILLLSSGWWILRYFGLRRQARFEEKPMPYFPVAAVALAVLCAAFMFLSAAKAYDNDIERGTIIEKKVTALSSPASDATPLFDLYEGLEVIIRGRSESWVQVSYPGGATGWIAGTAIFSTRDKVVR